MTGVFRRLLARLEQAGDYEPGGLQLADEEAVRLAEHPVGLHRLLAAIDEHMAADAVLYLEGSPTQDVLAYLERHAVEPTARIARGTIWPKPRVHHLPLRPAVMRGLYELAHGHAAPEVCDHLLVYRGDQILLSAYDAGHIGVIVSRSLDAGVVAALRARLTG